MRGLNAVRGLYLPGCDGSTQPSAKRQWGDTVVLQAGLAEDDGLGGTGLPEGKAGDSRQDKGEAEAADDEAPMESA